MNATDSILLPLADAGCLHGQQARALGARYRFWRDEDGLRHVFSVYSPDEAPSYPDAIAVVARRTPAGSIAMWAGPTGPEAEEASRRLDGDEIHIHVFGIQPAPALRRLMERSARPVRAETTTQAAPTCTQRNVPGTVHAFCRKRHAA